MTEYRFEGQDHVATFEYHEHRALGDHLHDIHRLRLDWTVKLLEDVIQQITGPVDSWIDYGCGQGGLLELAAELIPNGRGFDFMPANVADAEKHGRPVTYLNLAEPVLLPYSQLATATEVLEHLDDPHNFLRRVQADWFVATCPAGDTPERHDDSHLWGWDTEGFEKLFVDSGWEPHRINEVTIPGYPMKVMLMVASSEGKNT